MIPIAFGPNLASPDFLDLFRQPEQWAECRRRIFAFRFAREHVLAEREGQYEVGPNTFPALRAVNAFSQVRLWGLHTAIGVGAIGQSDCAAIGHARQTLSILDSIEEVGGRADYLIIDSPISFGRLGCQQSPEITAAAVTRYTAVIKDRYPAIGIGFVDGAPSDLSNACGAIADFATLLEQRGQAPAFVALDVDRNALVETNWFLRLVDRWLGRESLGYRRLREQWPQVADLPNSTMLLWGEADTAFEYGRRVREWAKWARTLQPQPKVLMVETWAGEGRTIPHNLPESDPTSHTGLLLDIARMWG